MTRYELRSIALHHATVYGYDALRVADMFSEFLSHRRQEQAADALGLVMNHATSFDAPPVDEVLRRADAYYKFLMG